MLRLLKQQLKTIKAAVSYIYFRHQLSLWVVCF